MSVFNLKNDQLPYIFTLLLAFIIWGLQHTVERILATPMIEYKIESKKIDNLNRITYSFTNLSEDKKYDSLKILFIRPKNDSIVNGRYIAATDMIIEDSVPPFKIDTADKANSSGSFIIKSVQPQQSFKIWIDINGNYIPELRYGTKDTVIIKKASCETYLVKHEYQIIFILIAIFFLVIIIYSLNIK